MVPSFSWYFLSFSLTFYDFYGSVDLCIVFYLSRLYTVFLIQNLMNNLENNLVTALANNLAAFRFSMYLPTTLYEQLRATTGGLHEHHNARGLNFTRGKHNLRD